MSDVHTILLTDVQGLQDGLMLYRDEAGNAASINLAACALRWGQAHPEAYPDPSKSRCVGERWFLHMQGTAYYELYTAPQRTRLCFPIVLRWQDKLMLRIGLMPPSYRRAWRSFTDMMHQLQREGWTTCDMT